MLGYALTATDVDQVESPFVLLYAHRDDSNNYVSSSIVHDLYYNTFTVARPYLGTLDDLHFLADSVSPPVPVLYSGIISSITITPTPPPGLNISLNTNSSSPDFASIRLGVPSDLQQLVYGPLTFLIEAKLVSNRTIRATVYLSTRFGAIPAAVRTC